MNMIESLYRINAVITGLTCLYLAFMVLTHGPLYACEDTDVTVSECVSISFN